MPPAKPYGSGGLLVFDTSAWNRQRDPAVLPRWLALQKQICSPCAQWSRWSCSQAPVTSRISPASIEPSWRYRRPPSRAVPGQRRLARHEIYVASRASRQPTTSSQLPLLDAVPEYSTTTITSTHSAAHSGSRVSGLQLPDPSTEHDRRSAPQHLNSFYSVYQKSEKLLPRPSLDRVKEESCDLCLTV